MDFRMEGFDDLRRKLNSLKQNAQVLDGSHSVRVSELLVPDFMRRYSKVSSFDALIKAGGYTVESQADFEAIPDAEWDKVIRTHTTFNSWQQMLEKAAAAYAERKLMKGV